MERFKIISQVDTIRPTDGLGREVRGQEKSLTPGNGVNDNAM